MHGGVNSVALTMNRLSSDHEQTQQWPWTDSAVAMNRLSSDHEQTQQWPWTDSAVAMNRLSSDHEQTQQWPWTECHIFLSRVIILLPTDLIFTAAGLKCRVPESLPLLHHSEDYICGSFGIDELILGQLYTYTPYAQRSVGWRELRSIYHYCSWTVSMKPNIHEQSQWNRVWYSLISCDFVASKWLLQIPSCENITTMKLIIILISAFIMLQHPCIGGELLLLNFKYQFIMPECQSTSNESTNYLIIITMQIIL